MLLLSSCADTVLNIYIKTMTEDDDKEVVAQACMSVADIVKDSGYAAIEPCKILFYHVTFNNLALVLTF